MRRLAVVFLLICGPGIAFASGEDMLPSPHQLAVQAQAKMLCHSTSEYKQALEFLRQTKLVIFPEQTSRLIAARISRGCDGAAKRFSQVLTLLKTVGLSDRKALAMALDFSGQNPDVQKNFVTVFTRGYLDEFFSYDYARALKLAIDLSKNYQGDPAQLRDDFISLSEYCKDKKSLDLPNDICADLAVKLARLSEYFPDGIRAPFHELYHKLRTDPDFGLDMKTALQMSYDILKDGPSAPDNFLSGFKFALSKPGLDMNKTDAMKFGLKMADRSFQGDAPPAIPGPDHLTDANRAAHL